MISLNEISVVKNAEIIRQRSGVSEERLDTPSENTSQQNAGFIYDDSYIVKTRHFCNQLKPEQKVIIRHLQKGKSAFVILPTGGGKTLPVTCYWIGSILGLDFIYQQPQSLEHAQLSEQTIATIISLLSLRTEDLHKVLIFVPTRALTNQFVDDLAYSLMTLITETLNVFLKFIADRHKRDYNEFFISTIRQILEFSPLKSFLNDFNEILRNPINNDRISQLNNLLREYISEVSKRLVLAITAGETKGDPEKACLVVSTLPFPKHVVNMAKKYNFSLVVFDEAQELFGPEGDQKVEFSKEDLKRAEAYYYIMLALTNKRTLVPQIVLLSGTMHRESAELFCRLTYKLTKLKIDVIDFMHLKGNPAFLKVVPYPHLDSMKTLLSICIKTIETRDNGTLIVLFSKKKIEELARQLMAKLNPSFDYSRGRGFRKRPEINPPDQEEKLELKATRDRTLSDASKISDEFLRECVKYGFAFIHSGITDSRDRSIIAQLFKEGRLPLLLATDAVGLGMNISVKQIYMPFIEKFNNNDFQKLPVFTMKQILNRAGRSYTQFAVIYTTPENVNTVVNMLSSAVPVLAVPKTNSKDFILPSPRNENAFIRSIASIFRTIFSRAKTLYDTAKTIYREERAKYGRI